MGKKHTHRYKVTSDSIFGLLTVNAVLICLERVIRKDGTWGLCGQKHDPLVLKYEQLEKKAPRSGGITYYWYDVELSGE